ncbi:hypothetical protein B0H14DRAFT_3430472 [Mycena olivaceomarginata]|nr:hypothetical protein B0H14DRAFT_3430472 [Mycena olivaceomarginata]
MSQGAFNTKNLTTLNTARRINSTRLKHQGIVRLSRRSASTRMRVALNTEDLPTFHTVHQPFNINGLSPLCILRPSRRSVNTKTRVAVNTQNGCIHDSAIHPLTCKDRNFKGIAKQNRDESPRVDVKITRSLPTLDEPAAPRLNRLLSPMYVCQRPQSMSSHLPELAACTTEDSNLEDADADPLVSTNYGTFLRRSPTSLPSWDAEPNAPSWTYLRMPKDESTRATSWHLPARSDEHIPTQRDNWSSRSHPDVDGQSGTFVIYSPRDGVPETPVNSFTINDLTCLRANLRTGGCLVSVHKPAEATLWLENHWDSSLLTSIRNSGCGGPFACMLSPEKPALAIFASYRDPKFLNVAQSLAESSGFPVVIRPAIDNPASTLLTPETGPPKMSVNSGGIVGNNNQSGRDVNENAALPEGGHISRQPGIDGSGKDDDVDGARSSEHIVNAAGKPKASRSGVTSNIDGSEGRSAANDSVGGPSWVDEKWESPLHRTRVELELKLNTIYTYTISVSYTFKPEVISLIDLKIETRPRETQVDRSYANIGFVAHRKKSIIERQFLHRGYDLPDRLFQRGQHRQNQRGISGALGFSQGSPLATATLSYNRSDTATLRATDSKVMPKCRVDYEIGDRWNKANKSYSSYNIAYQTQNIRLDDERSEYRPLEVKVGMGINLDPAASVLTIEIRGLTCHRFKGSEKPLPQMSFVNRNQVLIWVSDPTSKSCIRGIVVLMSSYLENIRTEEKLSIYEQEEIELGTESLPKEGGFNRSVCIPPSSTTFDNLTTKNVFGQNLLRSPSAINALGAFFCNDINFTNNCAH